MTTRSGPLSYEVQIANQVASRHASHLLVNRDGFHDFSQDQLEEQLDTTSPPLTQPVDQPVPLPALKEAAPFNPALATIEPTLASQPPQNVAPLKMAPLLDNQQPPASEAVKRELRNRAILKPRTRFADEFAGLGSKT